jgi:uncharacterized membrane protein (UPF0127 family)
MGCWIATGALGFFCALGFSGAAAAGVCTDGRIEIATKSMTHSFAVEVADAPDEQQVGLMNRDHMASAAGMLFVFDAPKRAQFWMKNTLIPLDIIFADAAGMVLRVHENAVPQDETTIDGGAGVQFVLEINGGLATPLGIKAGDKLIHPAIAPCAVQ